MTSEPNPNLYNLRSKPYSHHAYLYEGPLSLMERLTTSVCSEFGFTSTENPDVYVRTWEKFGIDDSRELNVLASLKSVEGRSLFILGISSLTSESQQALLKLFEEPQAGAVFVLLVPHGAVLPTLRSRFLMYPITLEGEAEGDEAKDFLSWPYKKRSDWITPFLKSDLSEAGAVDDDVRARVRKFLVGLETILHAKLSTAQKPLQDDIRDGLQDVAHFRDYVSDRAPSLKMILEHFAATLPLLK